MGYILLLPDLVLYIMLYFRAFLVIAKLFIIIINNVENCVGIAQMITMINDYMASKTTLKKKLM